MTESLFHNGCSVISLPLYLDNKNALSVAIKEPVSVFYELKSTI